MDWADTFAVSALEAKPTAFEINDAVIKQENFDLVSSNDSQLQVNEAVLYSPNTVSNGSIHAPSTESVLSSPSSKEIERFNGLNEEELKDKLLPDHLKDGLDIVIVGINPSLASAQVGHHYAGPGNHFWTCLSQAGLVPMPVSCYDDMKMLDYGIGFTNVCTRPTKGAAELTRKEMKSGAAIMLEKMRKYKPKIVVFNGKGIYEAYVGHKNFSMGRQPTPLHGTDTTIFVMPSSSARCAQLPRAEDKLPFFVALRKLRDFIRGDLPELPDSEVVFADYTEFRVTQPDPKSLRKAERRRKRKAEAAAAAAAATAAAISASTAGGEGLLLNGTILSTVTAPGGQQLVVDPTMGLPTSMTTNGVDMKGKSKSSKSSKRKRLSGSTPETCLTSVVPTQTITNISLTTEAQLQQQQQQLQQFQQQQHQAFFFQQQQQLQQQFAQPISQQNHLSQPQQQVIVSGGQFVSATPMVTLSMAAACPGATTIPVHPGAQAAMAAGCYATPQFQFSTQGATPQQFFISPHAPGTAAGQTFLQWSAASGTPGTPTAAVHFPQQQQSQQHQVQQQPVAATWQAVSTAALYNAQQPQQQHQQQQVGTAIQSAANAASGTTTTGQQQQQQQLLAAQQQQPQQQATVQPMQQQHLFFSPQHPMGLQTAATAAPAYPHHIYLAQAPAGASTSTGTYHLLPVGCPTSNFTSLLLSDQHQQQQHAQQPQMAQCSAASASPLQRAQTAIQLQASQQPSQQPQHQVQHFHQQQLQTQPQQVQQTAAPQQHTYIQPQHAAAFMSADLAAAAAAAGQASATGAATQFITLAPGAPVKVMAVGPNGQLIQTTGLPQFMPATPMGMSIGQHAAVQSQQQQAPITITAQRRVATPQQQQQANGRAVPVTQTTTYFTGTAVSSTPSAGEELVASSGNATLLATSDDKLVYTAL